jgi:hypothetical protein
MHQLQFTPQSLKVLEVQIGWAFLIRLDVVK